MFERLLGQRALIGTQRSVDPVDRVADPQPKVGRDLIVTRARRMQPTGRRPDQFAEPALDVHMDVLERALELELARFDL
jgi:hypothetical protein